MSSRLGSILVREGLLSPAQHLEVLEAAEDHEQPFVSELLRLGFVSEDRIVELFRRKFMVPIASQDMLARVPPPLIALVPAEMARGFMLCPCGEDSEGHVRIAMADPSDAHALDEVTYHTGRRVSRYAALESSLKWAIQHHYGVGMGARKPAPRPDPAEEVVLLTKVKVPGRRPPAVPARPMGPAPPAPPPPSPPRPAAPPPAAPPSPPRPAAPPPASPPRGAAPPPMSALPPLKKSSVRATSPGPPPPRIQSDDNTGVGRKRRGTLLGLPQRDLPLVRDRNAYADQAVAGESTSSPPPKISVYAEALRPITKPVVARTPKSGLWSSSAEASPSTLKSDAYGEAVLALKQAGNRDDVGNILISYFQSFFFDVAFLVVRKQHLAGYGGVGTRLKSERVPRLVIPLDQRSTFREVVASRLPYLGPLGPTPADAAFMDALGYAPDIVSLTPIQIRQKVIGMIYADYQHTEVGAGELEALLSEVELAYESIIRHYKGG